MNNQPAAAAAYAAEAAAAAAANGAPSTPPGQGTEPSQKRNAMCYAPLGSRTCTNPPSQNGNVFKELSFDDN